MKERSKPKALRESSRRPEPGVRSTLGVALRRGILEVQGIVLPEDLGPGGEADVSDVLDAAVAAWSAGRIATGQGVAFPEGAQRIGAIWR